MLGRRWRWVRPLVRRFTKAYEGKTRPRHQEVVQFLLKDRGFNRAYSKYSQELRIHRLLTQPPQMQPVGAAIAWNVPVIESVGALADWLRIDLDELAWFADLKSLERRKNINPQLRHYHYRVFTKRSGSIRLIESPKPRLKELQRQILAMLLDAIPLHPAAHGFSKGRSIKTFAVPHFGKRVILRMDLRDFFPSISRARVQAFFRTAGYPESVADLLGGLCTNATPRDAWEGTPFAIDPVQLREARSLYSAPHLPQGAPTSPALANLCSYRMDCRLAGLAESAGAAYTRYADDLVFSGGKEFERHADRFSIYVASVLDDEGFATNHHKTRIMRRSVSQQLTGLVVNERINIRRVDFDRLKATLTNCARLGPESQNREGRPNFKEHLEGRIGFAEMINPDKAKRLRRLWDKIVWTQ